MDSERIRSVFERIVREVEIVTDLRSRWTGSIEFVEDIDYAGFPAFRARKRPTCDVAIHIAYLEHPGLILTLIHEAFHSVSPGLTSSAFMAYVGFEEGVTEMLIRLHAPRIIETLGIQLSLEDRTAFNAYIDNLESLQIMTG